MKIATWNVNGIRARQAELQDWLERVQPDVVCLQEIKASTDQLPVWLCEIEGYWCYWHGGKGYSGVALHVSGHAGAGDVRLPGGQSDGTDVDREETIPNPGRPVVDLEVRAGMGDVHVEQGS